MSEMRTEAFRTHERPDYMPLARALLPKIRACAEDPEYMKRYEEWKRERNGQKEGR